MNAHFMNFMAMKEDRFIMYMNHKCNTNVNFVLMLLMCICNLFIMLMCHTHNGVQVNITTRHYIL